jgi:transaldolase
MKSNPLKKLESFGQSIWLDYIRRDLITSGDLLKQIENDGLRGMTSNPAIFQKSIAESNLYDSEIRDLAGQNKDVNTIYEAISQKDVQQAADVFRPVYDKTKGEDGYVSLEVSPSSGAQHRGYNFGRPQVTDCLKQAKCFNQSPGNH